MKIAVLIAVWATVAVGGLGMLLNYKQTAGVGAEAPPSFPQGADLALDPEHPTLLMFLHPECPCSRATVSELARVLTRVPGKLRTTVFMVSEDSSEAPSALAESAAKIDGVKVRGDGGGAEARRFGAHTSGQVLLFSTSGALLFSGGITPSRGHHGDNYGSGELERLALDPRAPDGPTHSNVYGCALFSAEESK